uniref:Retroviral polymerase SH3-like domain-containing protein n=1 Tax=Tanacetum cinerariifolium TaxID=118510 RepID=A0A6L2MZJ0_TANCI|nr:hypothetical protein [Tanacetum cinerariifolium]
MFDRVFRRVNTFEYFRPELVERKEKRAGEELEQEITKKQKVKDDKEKAELKQLMETILDEKEVAINAILLVVKSPRIVDWKIHKEGKKSYYQIVRADEKSQMYMIFSQMLKSFNREDLEDLYKLVCEALVKRDTPNKLESRSIKSILVGYPKEMIIYYFYYLPENKIFVSRYAEFFENILISQEASGSTAEFDEIKRQDTQPSEYTSEHQPEAEHDDVEPQTDVNLVRRSARIPQAPERYGFYVNAEEHELGDHGESTKYQASLLDTEFDK